MRRRTEWTDKGSRKRGRWMQERRVARQRAHGTRLLTRDCIRESDATRDEKAQGGWRKGDDEIAIRPLALQRLSSLLANSGETGAGDGFLPLVLRCETHADTVISVRRENACLMHRKAGF